MARVGFDGKVVSKAQSPEGEVGLAGATEQWCLKELGVGFRETAAEGDQGTGIAVGVSFLN